MLIQGKAKWTKVTGEPHWGYENKFKEWSLDVYVDEPTVERLVAEGLKEKVKYKDGNPFITFKRKELKADGSPNQPIRIVDHTGKVLQDKDTDYKGPKIGNGSTVNINFAINEFKPKQRNVAILSMQVWELIPYEGGEFPTREATETSDDSWEKEVA